MRKNYDFRGANRGPISKSTGKTRITIYLDDDVIDAYRKKADELGRGYQTLINEALRSTIGAEPDVIDAQTLRKILREELRRAG